MKLRHLGIILLLYLGYSCATENTNQAEKPVGEIAKRALEKIDIHAHYRGERDYLIPLLDSLNLTPVLVDVARVDTAEWMNNLRGLKTVWQHNPDRYYYCAAFAANGIDEESYAEAVIDRLGREIDEGARMVKVWKNFGMVSRDQQGNFVQIDDPRLQPIWDFLIERDIPVLAHIGEPLQAWRPLEDDNPHANYYRNHPEYHAYQHPEIPSWETIQEARNNWLERNPDLIVVGAHNGSMSHDVGLIGEHLERYPNFYVEPAARFGDFIRQDSEVVRNFFIKYQDRVLYGTDLGTSGDQAEKSAEELESERDGILRMMDTHFKYLSQSGEMEYRTNFSSSGRTVVGLGLPDSVLTKVYYQNAAKILRL